ncbi:MAG TPA: hypothetical protein VHE57_12925 [Mycobacteriales bacterium]|nr:hypothetical protein [Mycobacteriales bacterium]
MRTELTGHDPGRSTPPWWGVPAIVAAVTALGIGLVALLAVSFHNNVSVPKGLIVPTARPSASHSTHQHPHPGGSARATPSAPQPTVTVTRTATVVTPNRSVVRESPDHGDRNDDSRRGSDGPGDE